jgi:MFS transporter, DHA1 family, solute carrier family 18 (vesicular amine transporter), member 1/2
MIIISLLLFQFTVPIIPEFLYDIRHPDAPLSSFSNEPPQPASTLPPCQGVQKAPDPFNLETTTMAAENVSWYAEREVRHKELVEETVEIGLMFASKAFVQLLANPIVGPLTHK